MTGTLVAALPDAVERAAADLLKATGAAGLTLASVENCTGGMLAALLTDGESATDIVDHGFVVSCAAAKCEWIGVDRAILDDHGAVGREVAEAMARGAVRGSDAAIDQAASSDDI